MRRKSHATDLSSEEVVKDIRRATRKRYSAEEKIRIVLDGLRGEHSIAELCRREGIAEGLYYSWSKEFLEAGKRRLAGDTARTRRRHWPSRGHRAPRTELSWCRLVSHRGWWRLIE
jgi:transposase